MQSEKVISDTPDADPLPSFLPTIPAWTIRYEPKKERSPLTSLPIRPGHLNTSGSQIPTLPEGWRPFTQPEGRVYFSYGVSPRFITDSWIHTPSVLAKVIEHMQTVTKALKNKDITLPESTECFLSPDEDSEKCYYYMADHAAHMVSWLTEVSMADVGLRPASSEVNLRWALEEQYWCHLEQFPSHCPSSLFLAVDELIPIFIHGESDQRTSQTSTFPYTAKQCKEFIRLLQMAAQDTEKSTSIWIIARLWSTMTRYRFECHYGEECARLDRTQTVVEASEAKGMYFFSTTSRILFGIPADYAHQVEKIWTDDLVYKYVWREFITKTNNEWTQNLTWSLGLSIFNAILLLVPHASNLLATFSLVCCAVAAFSAITLATRHRCPATDIEDNAVASFLVVSAEDNHHRTALAFSLPRAFFFWALGLTATQGLLALERATHIYVLAALAVLVFIASLPWARWSASVSSQVSKCLVWRRAPRSIAADDVMDKV